MVDDARWPVRSVPRPLRERYVAEGWWTNDTLGALVDRSLRAAPDAGIHIWSQTRPWHGTYADLLIDAQRLVSALRGAGIAPGDAVAFQLPNWREAVVAFYGLALGGYVLVPIEHIYGAKEVRFILAQSGARVHLRRFVRRGRLRRHRRGRGRRRAREARSPRRCR
jgi:non-ribosomal peptide synthetase component E (peptide arylation enzyme)